MKFSSCSQLFSWYFILKDFAITFLYPKIYTFAVYKKWKWRKSLIFKFQGVDIKLLYLPWKHENNKKKKKPYQSYYWHFLPCKKQNRYCIEFCR